MKTIKQTYHIHASVKDVWNALVDPKKIASWGGGEVHMDDKVGTDFKLWDGAIWGTNTVVVPYKKLVQDWYSKEENKWESPSRVTFTLVKEKDGVRLDLVHNDVPDMNAYDIEDGWKEFYLGPLKEFVENK